MSMHADHVNLLLNALAAAGFSKSNQERMDAPIDRECIMKERPASQD
jgi:hypothetical protein